jgi:hypothetical protein
MAKTTVFYSWQSDLPNNTNRGLIGEALERAIAAIGRDDTIDVVPVVDRDTFGVPGSPNIAESILEKIAAANVFVPDVTIVTPADAPRPSPNPNVLVELGFALGVLGWERIVMVMNTAFGDESHLPFDLRGHRVLSYSFKAPVGTDKSEQRGVLEARLRDALKMILQQPAPAREELTLRELANSLSDDAKDLLLEASRDVSHSVLEMSSNAGLLISVGARQFVEPDSARSEARWRAVVQTLLRTDLLVRENPNDSILFITHNGFRAADILWKEQPRLSLVADMVRQEPAEFVLGIMNEAECAAAFAPYLKIDLPPGVSKTLYGLDGNRRDGLPADPRTDNTLTFRGGSESVIHGGTVLKVTKITKERWASEVVEIRYELTAQNARKSTGTLKV